MNNEDNIQHVIILCGIIAIVIMCAFLGCRKDSLTDYDKLKIDTEATDEYVKRKRGY